MFRWTDWALSEEYGAMPRILALSAREEFLSFAVGLPPTELLPHAALAQAFQRVLASPGAAQLGPPHEQLRRELCRLLAMRGLSYSPGEVLVTQGAQQALDLIIRTLVPAGGCVVTDPASYPGFRQALSPVGGEAVSFGDGPLLDLGLLDRALADGFRPALIYTTADGHNPTGATMPLSHRESLTALARNYDIPILEDDAYGLLSLDGACRPALASDNRDGVLYVGSLSKVLAPGLRVGWIAAPEAAIAKLKVTKDVADINCASLVHHAVADYLERGLFPGHLEAVRADFRRRRDMMLAAAERYLPDAATVFAPDSGVFLWVELPPWCNADTLLERSIVEERLLFVPGSVFGDRARSSLRLCYTSCRPELIEEGMARLGATLSRYLTRAAVPVARRRRRRQA